MFDMVTLWDSGTPSSNSFWDTLGHRAWYRPYKSKYTCLISSLNVFFKKKKSSSDSHNCLLQTFVTWLRRKLFKKMPVSKNKKHPFSCRHKVGGCNPSTDFLQVDQLETGGFRPLYPPRPPWGNPTWAASLRHRWSTRKPESFIRWRIIKTGDQKPIKHQGIPV